MRLRFFGDAVLHSQGRCPWGRSSERGGSKGAENPGDPGAGGNLMRELETCTKTLHKIAFNAMTRFKTIAALALMMEVRHVPEGRRAEVESLVGVSERAALVTRRLWQLADRRRQG